MSKPAETVKRPDRAKKVRVPLGARNRLTFTDKEEGYEYRIINDTDSRLQAALDAGYEFVTSDEKLGDERVAEAKTIGSKVSKPVGNGVTGYLMRIPQEWHNETQEEKMKKIDTLENSMKPDTTKNQYGSGLKTE